MKMVQSKIPILIVNVMGYLVAKDINMVLLDEHVEFLITLSPNACNYLMTSKFSKVYENDFALLIDTLELVLVYYEKMELYERCEDILEALNAYKELLPD